MTLTAVDTEGEPQTQLFQLPPLKITEKRASLASVKGVPLPDDFEATYDQPVRFTGVGDIKGIVPRRENGLWRLTYEIETAEIVIEPLSHSTAGVSLDSSARSSD